MSVNKTLRKGLERKQASFLRHANRVMFEQNPVLGTLMAKTCRTVRKFSPFLDLFHQWKGPPLFGKTTSMKPKKHPHAMFGTRWSQKMQKPVMWSYSPLWLKLKKICIYSRPFIGAITLLITDFWANLVPQPNRTPQPCSHNSSPPLPF